MTSESQTWRAARRLGLASDTDEARRHRQLDEHHQLVAELADRFEGEGYAHAQAIDLAEIVYSANGAEPDDANGERPDRRLTARQICATPDPDQPPELCGPLLARGERLVLGASTGHGKSTFTARLIGAITNHTPFLDYTGAGGRALIVDAEQSIRDIKRVLTETGLSESDQIDYLVVPDGLTLDQPDSLDVLELADYLATTEYAVVALDPAYKLHRSDSNEERGAVDLMRRLDAWRDAYQFGLILPMHTRKPPAGLQLRLTIHELFGSSAYTRGAEVVLGLELVRPGYSRMHVLKHRRGELQTGERWGLVYDRDTGYRRDPRETSDEPSVAERVRRALSETPGLTRDEMISITGASKSSVSAALAALGAAAAKGRFGTKTWSLDDDQDGLFNDPEDDE
jgi:hypothetical protein